MVSRVSLTWFVVLLFAASNLAQADGPKFVLGDKPSFGLFQPRVSAEILRPDGTSMGPTSTAFLLDTGASGVVIYPPATTELAENGFENVAEYDEAGISGTSTFDLSAPYTLNYTASTGTEQVHDIRFLSGRSPVDPTGLMGLNGIVGMPAMDGRVTTLDNREKEASLPTSMRVGFSDSIPDQLFHRFTVPLTELHFPTEGELVPTFESLSTLDVVSENNGNISIDPIVLDSGAQVTIINEDIATRLGLDANGNGEFSDEALSTVPLSGATGTINAPVLEIPEMRIPTDQGFELVWKNAQVVVQDIHPLIGGVLGADFMSGDGGLDFTALTGGGLGGGIGGELGELLGELLGGEGGLGDLLGGDLGDLLGGGGLGDLGDLLGGGDLGGLLGGAGGGNPLNSLPLDSYFDRVHFDFREFPESGGKLVFDLNQTLSAQVLNGDHVFDSADIDDLTSLIDSASAAFDLNGDGIVLTDDRDILITEVFNTVPGDVDLNQNVDFRDFLVMSQNFSQQGGWADGDFDGNGTVDFADFLLQSSNFGFVASASSVPEPSGFMLLLFGGLLLRRRRR